MSVWGILLSPTMEREMEKQMGNGMNWKAVLKGCRRFREQGLGFRVARWRD